MSIFKALLGITLLLSFTLLYAQEADDKATKHYIYEMVREGTISPVSGIACQKVDTILSGESESVSVTISNPHGLSLGDFFIIFMGYAMQDKFVVKPDITITIQ